MALAVPLRGLRHQPRVAQLIVRPRDVVEMFLALVAGGDFGLRKCWEGSEVS